MVTVPPAIIAAVIGAAATATEVGVQLSGAGQPSQPKQTTPAPAGPTADQVKAAVAPQAYSIESATGGSVSPEYLSTIAPILAGVGGQQNTTAGTQSVLQQIFGGGAAPSAPFSPSGLNVNLGALASTPGTSDYLQKIATG